MELEQMLHKLDLVKQQHTSQLQAKEAENQLEREHQRLLLENEVKFYESLKDMSADVTQIIVAKQRNPDKIIQVVNDQDRTKSAPIQFTHTL